MKKAEKVASGWIKKEESYVMDGGMPALIRVWELWLSVRYLPVNGPVSPQPGRDAVNELQKEEMCL